MDDRRKFESVYSQKIRAGKRRTYFFDVRQTRGEDYFLTITESTRRYDGNGYERHKIFLYKEDFNRFVSGLTDAVDHIKTELMPDYDYDEFTRRNEEYEARKAAGEFDNPDYFKNKDQQPEAVEVAETEELGEAEEAQEPVDEDDMKW